MKLFSALRTPAWEQRDPERRANAVRDEQAPELIARLAQIAVRDEAPVVRRAALARLNDLALLLERQRADPDAATQTAALTRATRLLLDPSAGATPSARLEAIPTLPTELLERVAEAAPEVELRRAAGTRIARPAWLLRRAADDPDPALRLEWLARIDDVTALERLAENARRRDKTLAHAARERAQALRLERGDAQALERAALTLCDALTAWAQHPPQDIDAQLAQAEQRWQARREALDEAVQRRVEAHFARVHEALAMRVKLADAVAAEPPPVAAPPPTAAPPIDWSTFDRELDAARRAAADRKLGHAKPALERARAALATLPSPDRARREKLEHVEAKLTELDEWQRWSGNRARARACEQLEALIAAGHHPDAVLEGVREAQREWARIEAAEPGDADRGSGLARRFRALCARAMAPTQPYFEQRQALRDTRRATMEALLARVVPEIGETHTPPQLVALRRELTQALRQLDEVEPKARTALARGLRAALSQLDAALSAQRDAAVLARQQHLAKLRRELTRAEPASAAAMVRQRQTEWAALPRAGREQQAELEAQWRALVEPVFAQERARHEQVTQQAQHVEQESKRLLDELAALAASDASGLTHADSRIAALSTAWRELHATAAVPVDGARRGREGREGRERRRAPPPRATERDRAFDAAVAKVRRAQQALDTTRREERLRALVAAAELFAQVEQDRPEPEAAQTRWTALSLDPADRRRLEPRWQRAVQRRGAPADDAASASVAQTWLVEAELDADLDSPPEAQTLRRQLQMQRLATRLQGAALAGADARERLLRWAELEPAPIEAGTSARLARLLEAWLRRPIG